MKIIAGSAKGRNFTAPEGESTRPTGARQKEAIFGVIQFDIPGAQVLDLFSGSGSLAFECLSRGAGSVLCNDSDAACTKLIKNNAAALNFTKQIEIYNLDYKACLKQIAEKKLMFDLIFLDPPYFFGFEHDILSFILNNHMLKAGGKIIFEHASTQELPYLKRIIKSKRYGKTSVSFYA